MVPALAVCRNAARLLLAAAALFPAAASRAQPLTLEEALKAGEALSPALAAQRYAIDAAGHQLGRATELPDPRLRFGIENLPVTGADRLRYDRDFMTARAIGVMQELPNPAKRAARGERAARLHEVEQANLAAQRVLLRRDVAIAWLELHYAQRARDALARVAGEYALQIDAVAAGIARGRQTAADSYTLRALQEQANDRVIEQERIVSRARIALAALIGEAANRELAAPPDVAQLAPSGEALLARLAAQPLLRVYDERESLARAEAGLARATRNPDWSVELSYGQRSPLFDNMLSVMFAIDLPVNKERRQDKDVASRVAEIDQTRARREEARRQYKAEARGLLADHDAARRRLGRIEAVLLPLERERVQATFAAYRGGRGELGPVLEAQRAVAEAELARVQAQAARARAWAGLSFLFPDEVPQ